MQRRQDRGLLGATFGRMSLLDRDEKIISIFGSIFTIAGFVLMFAREWTSPPDTRSVTHWLFRFRWPALLVGVVMLMVVICARYLGNQPPTRMLDEDVTLNNSPIPQRSFDIAGWKFVEKDSYSVTINCRSPKVLTTGCEEGKAPYFDFDPGDGFALGRAKGNVVNQLSSCNAVTYGQPELPVREGDVFCAWKPGQGVTAFKITRLPNPTPPKGQIIVHLEAASWPAHEA